MATEIEIYDYTTTYFTLDVDGGRNELVKRLKEMSRKGWNLVTMAPTTDLENDRQYLLVYRRNLLKETIE